jgi:hypothetical protein
VSLNDDVNSCWGWCPNNDKLTCVWRDSSPGCIEASLFRVLTDGRWTSPPLCCVTDFEFIHRLKQAQVFPPLLLGCFIVCVCLFLVWQACLGFASRAHVLCQQPSPGSYYLLLFDNLVTVVTIHKTLIPFNYLLFFFHSFQRLLSMHDSWAAIPWGAKSMPQYPHQMEWTRNHCECSQHEQSCCTRLWFKEGIRGTLW